MQSLLEALRKTGLSEEQAIETIRVTFKWTSEHYPVTAALARSAILHPCGIDSQPVTGSRSNPQPRDGRNSPAPGD